MEGAYPVLIKEGKNHLLGTFMTKSLIYKKFHLPKSASWAFACPVIYRFFEADSDKSGDLSFHEMAKLLFEGILKKRRT